MIKEAVRGIRTVRTSMNVPPSKKGKGIRSGREAGSEKNFY